MNPAHVALAIIAFWAVLATIVMIIALRSLSNERRYATGLRKERDNALSVAERWRSAAMEQRKPARDGSDGISVGRALRKITGPVKPTSARTPSTSRNSDSTDSLILAATAPTFAPAPVTDTSCDTSPSVDSGACGGAE